MTLTALAKSGSLFSGWTDACSGTADCVVTMVGNKTVTAVFTQPLSVNFSVPRNGELGVAYNAILTPEGGFPPYGFEVVSGALPQGLNLNSAAIVGTPLLTGGRAFTLRVTDQLGSSVTRKFKITIYKPLGITTTRLVPGRVGRNYRAVVKVSGAKTPYTWSLVSGNLPTGLSLQSTGRITGVPTETGQFSLTFEVSDSLGGKAQKGFTLIINP